MSRTTPSRKMVVALALALQMALSIGTAAPAAADEDAHNADLDGQQIYVAQCARCHQVDGAGVPGIYPQLNGATELWSERSRSIRTLLAGRSGPVEVAGRLYDHVMPTHGYLANETIASTLTFLLKSWGPGGAAYTAEEVAAVRLELMAAHPLQDETITEPSPLADMEAIQYVTSEGPPMSVDEFEEARRIYYGNCTGCHGVLREGTAGNPLTPELMRERGTEYLQSVINYGASTGMPNWGTSDALSGRQINLLARFLQHPVPQPPDMDLFQVRDGWQQFTTGAERPTRPQHGFDLDAMFVATLHDPGQIMLIDGPSRRIITTIEVGRGPHRVTTSASGRYLYVICRDGTLSLIDLYTSPPTRVASARVGYEARAVGASMHPDFKDRFVLAGAYWPPQVVLLDGTTLEPLRLVSTRGYSRGGRRYHPEPRVTDVAGSRKHPEFLAEIKETGQMLVFPYDQLDTLQIGKIDTVRELRAGAYSTDGRFYLTPADTNAVSVFDIENRRIEAEIPARVFGGSTGVAYRHAKLGPVWVTSTMVGNDLVVIGTDPEGHADTAWQILAQVPGPAAGSLFLASHPKSRHLWLDTPLASDPAFSQSVTVFDRDSLEDGSRQLPIARWSGRDEGPRRVVQPTFDNQGQEVWVLVWNPQDQGSAIVIVNDTTLKQTGVIDDNRLITPTRLYNIGELRRLGGQ